MVPSLSFLADAAAVTALLLLATAAVSDVAVRRIPNHIAVLVALTGLVRQGSAGGATLSMSLAVAGFVFLAAFLLWMRGVVGGGDVKLLAAVALIVPPVSVPMLMAAIALTGGALALLHLGLRPLLVGRFVAAPHHAFGRALRREALRIRRRAPLPYGVAIALGTAFVMLRSGG